MLSQISWEGATESPSNPTQATLSKANAGKNLIKIKYGNRVLKELRVWVVWSNITAVAVPITTGRGTIGGITATKIEGGYNFTYAILPTTIVTDADRPNLSGANLTPPPGGTELELGADKKWDGSRQKRSKVLNPNNIPDEDISQPPPTQIPSYPANEVEGNDDRRTSDPENNDPYSNNGNLSGEDVPTLGIRDTAGFGNNTYESRLQFREFARLEIEGNWYRISDFFLWRIHRRFIKRQGQWRDDGSDIALDNEGF